MVTYSQVWDLLFENTEFTEIMTDIHDDIVTIRSNMEPGDTFWLPTGLSTTYRSGWYTHLTVGAFTLQWSPAYGVYRISTTEAGALFYAPGVKEDTDNGYTRDEMVRILDAFTDLARSVAPEVRQLARQKVAAKQQRLAEAALQHRQKLAAALDTLPEPEPTPTFVTIPVEFTLALPNTDIQDTLDEVGYIHAMIEALPIHYTTTGDMDGITIDAWTIIPDECLIDP